MWRVLHPHDSLIVQHNHDVYSVCGIFFVLVCVVCMRIMCIVYTHNAYDRIALSCG